MSRFITKIDVPRSAYLDPTFRASTRDEYGWHQLVWCLFPEAQERKQERSFVYRVDLDSGCPVLHIVSKGEPGGTFPAGASQHTKRYDPVLADGERLRFRIRLNATVSRKTSGRSRGVVHDVAMDAKARASEVESGLSESLRVHHAVSGWFVEREDRLGCTFAQETLVVSNYKQHAFRRKGRGRAIRFSSVDVDGVLYVTQAASLRNALFQGVGRSRAWGCGMMLVKRA